MSVTKDQILSEIRRTANENGGVPLGRRRFVTETGIRIADWRGRFWAEWGDALREAGFSANQFNSAYPEERFLESCVQLTRALGHLPTQPEISLKHRSDDSLPSAEAFRARFGPKSALIDRLRVYCLSQIGYEDIVALCEAYTPAPARTAARLQQDEAGEWGSVYLMKSGRFYKIGRSNSAGRREYELAIQLPEKLSTVHVISTDDPAGIEAYWHHRFKHKRKGGEWFDLDSTDITAFKRRKFM